MTANQIREQFLDFFRSKGHLIVPSAPIVVKNDPTLLFTNAGMNQFKDYFLGNRKAPHSRVADSQKCLRVSGKHNDLEEVGVDTYHHTMFEMLGNWSFGDSASPEAGYFKKEAIAWSWELLTEVYKIPPENLYVTVFEGDDQLPKDMEAIAEWKKWISEDRVLLFGKKDNFWEMGDTGPCGPCTEIHVDCRSEMEKKKVDGRELVNRDDPAVIEIWNNVFIQFNRLKDGSLQPLPARHVDTGMGLERLVRVLQRKVSNYDTDLFAGTIKKTEDITLKRYGGTNNKNDVAFRVIADHIRAIAFSIADGQLPSNTGAGYVIRRILRRAVRYAYSHLDHKQPLLFRLIPDLAEQFKHVFPELARQKELVSKVIKEEEESFLTTLEKGISRFEEELRKKALSDKKVPGSFAFTLYDTYGFPLDLTMLMAREQGYIVDINDFEQHLQEQKARSRSASVVDTGDWMVLNGDATTSFVGYEKPEVETQVTRYRKVKAKGKEAYQVVLKETPFYAEGGGQVGDRGLMDFNGEMIDVIDTKKENELIVHFCEKLPDQLATPVRAVIDKEKRQRTAIHHTATHLMHAALRFILGTHVAQKGSLVNDEYLRFDFSHFSKVTDDELAAIEKLVNEKILENIQVDIEFMPKEQAEKLGAMALFGEKYGDVVRVVIVDRTFSMELCGGTHVNATGELGFFKIKSESAVAAGVRRIEAVCGFAGIDYVNQHLHQLKIIREILKSPKDIVKSISDMLAENSDLRKRIELLEQKNLQSLRAQLLGEIESTNSHQYLGRVVEVSSADSLKRLCSDLRNQVNGAVLLCAAIDGKANVAIGISEALSDKLDASRIIKEIVAPLIKGGGGGQKNLSTAGGSDSSQFPEIIERVRSLL